ncbi:MAG: hypothetical protein AAGE94_18545 [Acidobacteriota bacterium]
MNFRPTFFNFAGFLVPGLLFVILVLAMDLIVIDRQLVLRHVAAMQDAGLNDASLGVALLTIAYFAGSILSAIFMVFNRLMKKSASIRQWIDDLWKKTVIVSLAIQRRIAHFSGDGNTTEAKPASEDQQSGDGAGESSNTSRTLSIDSFWDQQIDTLDRIKMQAESQPSDKLLDFLREGHSNAQAYAYMEPRNVDIYAISGRVRMLGGSGMGLILGAVLIVLSAPDPSLADYRVLLFLGSVGLLAACLAVRESKMHDRFACQMAAINYLLLPSDDRQKP